MSQVTTEYMYLRITGYVLPHSSLNYDFHTEVDASRNAGIAIHLQIIYDDRVKYFSSVRLCSFFPCNLNQQAISFKST